MYQPGACSCSPQLHSEEVCAACTRVAATQPKVGLSSASHARGTQHGDRVRWLQPTLLWGAAVFAAGTLVTLTPPAELCYHLLSCRHSSRAFELCPTVTLEPHNSPIPCSLTLDLDPIPVLAPSATTPHLPALPALPSSPPPRPPACTCVRRKSTRIEVHRLETHGLEVRA